MKNLPRGARPTLPALGLLLAALAWPPPLAAQPPSIEPPVAGRPPQFSEVVGNYSLAISAAPAEVPVEEPITLRVTIAGKGPAKYQPVRKNLKLFPDGWAKDFFVEPVPEEDRLRSAEGRWEFVYRLRPKHQKVEAIDGVKLVYFQPPSPTGPGRFQTAYAEPIALTVRPPRPPPEVPDGVPVKTAPATFYELPDARAVLAAPPAGPTWPGWLVAVALLAPPLVTVAGVRAWRALFPTEGEQARRHRSRSARRALQALHPAAGEPPWVVVGLYLRERLDFPSEEPTPAEVRRFLRRRGASRKVADHFAGLLGACDGARFAGAAAVELDRLRAEAGRLIHALEEDLCAP
jgi:hypothetical protein